MVVWVLFSIGVAMTANGRGKNPLGWFLISCVISPLLAIILLIASPSREGGASPSWME
jgi:hypothetical protein